MAEIGRDRHQPVDAVGERGHRRVADEGQRARHCLEQGQAQRVDIALGLRRLALRLLWRAVLGVIDAVIGDRTGRRLRHHLGEADVDLIFNIAEGVEGRNREAQVPALCELLGIPYTGSGVMASALAMDKWRTKLVWLASGVPTPRYRVVDAATDWAGVVAELGLPLIVKPAREGSTIGLTKVTAVAHGELANAYAGAAKHDDLVLVEEFVAGVELTTAIVGERALPLIRIEAPQGNYDYHHKYFSDETRYFCPCGLPEAKEREIQAASLAAFRVVGCAGWGRLDLILRADGTFQFLEVNTSPGMTGHSLVPMAAKQAGMAFADLCVAILRGAHVG